MEPEPSANRSNETPVTRADIDAQRAETGVAGTVGPSTPALPNSMSRGLWRGGALGAVGGALVLLPLALIPILDLTVWARVVTALVVGGVAGAAVGAVFFGGAVAESESEDDTGDDSVVPDVMHHPHR